MKDVIFSVFKNENYIDLDLYQCGREICRPGHIFGPSIRNHYLFHYVISGKGKLIAANSSGTDVTYEIYAGQGFMLFPDQINTYMSDAADPWTYAWIEFDGLRVKEALERTSLSMDHPVYRSHTPEQRKEMVDEMEKIIMNSQHQPTLWTIGHLYLFFNALIESVRKTSEKKTSKLAEYYVKEAVAYIEQNYHRALSVEEISEILGIDRSYFGKLFKRVMGKSPQQFIIHYRMVKAAYLLRSTQKPIQEISLSVGYENQLHFSRAFKSVYGKSPRTWRKEQAEEAAASAGNTKV